MNGHGRWWHLRYSTNAFMPVNAWPGGLGHRGLACHQTQPVPTITSTAPLCMSPGNPFVVSLKAIATALLWAVSLVAGANASGTAVAVAATPSIDFTPA